VVLPVQSPKTWSRGELWTDPDDAFAHIERVAVAAGCTCVRADFSEHGGFTKSSILERLLIADLVVADVTIANPHVMYVTGVRQGVAARPTILISGCTIKGGIPAASGMPGVLSYTVGENDPADPRDGTEFDTALLQRLRQAIDDDLPTGIPLLDATGWAVGGRLEHDKTDVFLERIATTTESGRRIRAALELSSRDASIHALNELVREILDHPHSIPDLDTGLLGIYLGYRECAAYQHMADLYSRMPPDLQSTPVAKEQLALAFNRLAEAAARDGSDAAASELRQTALDKLNDLDSRVVTAETWSIRGRIYKGGFQAAAASGREADAHEMLAMAIESYEQAIVIDMRDYFPGINAITLRLTRGTPGDIDAARNLIPVVRIAVENAPVARSEQEQYWQVATKVELACAAEDWSVASREIESLVFLDVGNWMYETTINNLNLYRRLFDQDIEAAEHMDSFIGRLKH
jgi:hypothetical protein